METIFFVEDLQRVLRHTDESKEHCSATKILEHMNAPAFQAGEFAFPGKVNALERTEGPEGPQPGAFLIHDHVLYVISSGWPCEENSDRPGDVYAACSYTKSEATGKYDANQRALPGHGKFCVFIPWKTLKASATWIKPLVSFSLTEEGNLKLTIF